MRSSLDFRKLVRPLRTASLVLLVGHLAVVGKDVDAARFEHPVCDSPSRADSFVEGRERGGKRAASLEVLPDVTLPVRVEEKLRGLADRYQRKTGKSLVITSGTRDAQSQAEVIYDKLELKDDVVKLYKNKPAVLELKRAYELGRAARRDRAAIISTLADLIKQQVKRGIFISAHLKANAADVRSTNMNQADRLRFVEEAQALGGLAVMFETTPPHFHLQLQ